jgi:UDP-glucose 4-epimerase
MGAARIATAYHHTHGVPVSHVRAFNAFGPGQAHGHGHPRKIIPAFATEAWNDEPMIVWGDGRQGVDLVHVDDVARMLLDASLHGDDATFDAGTATSFTVNDVADMVIDIVGKGTVRHLPMRRGERPTRIVAQGDGWDRLDWRPEFRFLDLEEAVQWYRPS